MRVRIGVQSRAVTFEYESKRVNTRRGKVKFADGRLGVNFNNLVLYNTFTFK